MVAYSFKDRFVAPILDNVKRQTIRAPRKGRSRHARPGEALQLYTAMRTRYCTLIGLAKCELVMPILLDFTTGNRVVTDGIVFRSADNLDEFAQMDGFSDWAELRAFWAEAHPGANHFNGALIRWTGFEPRKSHD